MTSFTTILTDFAVTQTDSPLFVGALMLTFVGIGAIVASFVMATREQKAKR